MKFMALLIFDNKSTHPFYDTIELENGKFNHPSSKVAHAIIINQFAEFVIFLQSETNIAIFYLLNMFCISFGPKMSAIIYYAVLKSNQYLRK